MHENRCLSNDELRQLLEGDVVGADDDPHIIMHLESCGVCREAMERLAGSGPTGHSKEEIQTACKFYQSSIRDDSRQATSKLKNPETPASISQFLREIGVTEIVDQVKSAARSLGRIGNVELEHLLGQGGMGMVFKGRDSILDRPVAVKIIDPSVASNPLARQRFLQEARLAASINHPNVVKIHSVNDSGTTPALIMEFVDGQSLRQRVGEPTPLAESQVRGIARQIAEGLSAAHAKKIIHRDIKPGNLLLEKGTDQIKIADFGLAFATEKSSYMTSDGVVLGTPEYMSPEQVRGVPLDARSDLFSLGTVLYEMCTGRLPFGGQSVMSIAYNIANEPFAPIRQLNPDISEEFSDLIERLLNKSTKDRIQTADELIALLDGKSSKPGASGRYRVVAIIGLAFVAFAIVFATTKIDWNRDDKNSSIATNRPIQIEGRESAFDDLPAAFDAAAPGDTILLQGVDSFHLSSREISTRQLTIRGIGDHRAKLILEEPRETETWISLTGVLTMENIDLEIPSRNQAGKDRRQSAITISNSGKLQLLNCRVVATGFIGAIFLNDGSLNVTDSSLFAAEGIGIASESIGKNKLFMDNALLVSRNAMVWTFESRSNLSDEEISITRSTIRSDTIYKLQQSARGTSRSTTSLPFSIHSTQTVFAGDKLLEIGQLIRPAGKNRRIKFSDFVNKSIDWFGKDNLYGKDLRFFDSNKSEMDVEAESLAEWTGFWKDREQQSVQEKLEFVGSRDSVDEQNHVLVNLNSKNATQGRIGFSPRSDSK